MRATYKQILSISLPIMLASAAQNFIALSDSVILYYKSELDFAAIGFIGVFYLVISAIGYGFSKGGQIAIARRLGEGNNEAVGRTFYAMLYFELAMATVMFLIMQFICPWLFRMIFNEIGEKCAEFLKYRSWGVFFSYMGVSIISLYTGISRTKFIMIDTLLLGIVNIILCYGFVFGNYGLPAMGIAGAGLASTLAEAFAFFLFLIYMFFDKKIRKFDIFHTKKLDIGLIKQLIKLSTPIVMQAVVGIGSWVIFFGMVESVMGKHQLAICNILRNIYLLLSIPCWGFASGVNTLVSTQIGQDTKHVVFNTINKTVVLCLVTTLILSIPLLMFPDSILQPMIDSTKGDVQLFIESKPLFPVLMGILVIFSIGGIYFNGLAGTGATLYGLQMQIICAIVYLVFITVVMYVIHGSLALAWSSEIIYWLIMTVLSVYYLRTNRWHGLKV
jgi:putative MATE family efflux protein